MKYLLVVILLLLSPCVVCAEQTGQIIDDFENGLRPAWKEKVFQGRTGYRVVREGTGHALQAESQGTASALILEQKIDLQEYPVLSWRWKVEKVLAKGDARRKEGDDYAARIYVIFPHWFFPKTRAINYIWANQLPPGAIVPNAFTSRAIMIAVESGEAHAGSGGSRAGMCEPIIGRSSVRTPPSCRRHRRDDRHGQHRRLSKSLVRRYPAQEGRGSSVRGLVGSPRTQSARVTACPASVQRVFS
ncbi:MAG: DUF3047 domain-containing protein [Syntrophotaleaceae bacterium]